MPTRKEAQEHLDAGGTIQYRSARRELTCQRTKTKYRNKRDVDSFWCKWRNAEFGFLENPSATVEDLLQALETLELLPIPKKIRCTSKQEAIEHMKKGGLIEYTIDTTVFQYRIDSSGRTQYRYLRVEGSFTEFVDQTFLTELSVRNIQATRLALNVYETLYLLLPIEEDNRCC
jgi:hypothetical protein